MKRVSIDVSTKHRELGKENISRDKAQRHTMFTVWEMQRCEQRKIQNPEANPDKNGILKPSKKGFQGESKQH